MRMKSHMKRKNSCFATLDIETSVGYALHPVGHIVVPHDLYLSGVFPTADKADFISLTQIGIGIVAVDFIDSEGQVSQFIYTAPVDKINARSDADA